MVQDLPTDTLALTCKDCLSLSSRPDFLTLPPHVSICLCLALSRTTYIRKLAAARAPGPSFHPSQPNGHDYAIYETSCQTSRLQLCTYGICCGKRQCDLYIRHVRHTFDRQRADLFPCQVVQCKAAHKTSTQRCRHKYREPVRGNVTELPPRGD